MKDLERRAAAIAGARTQARAEQLAEQIKQAAPDVAVEIDGEDVMVTGAHLLRRWLLQADLRAVGGGR